MAVQFTDLEEARPAVVHRTSGHAARKAAISHDGALGEGPVLGSGEVRGQEGAEHRQQALEALPRSRGTLHLQFSLAKTRSLHQR